MTLRTVVDDTVAALTAGGVNASADPRYVTLPGVWVQVESVAHVLLRGVSVRLRLYLIAADGDTAQVLDVLSPLLAQVVALVPPNTDIDTTSAVVYLPDNPTTALPALQLAHDALTGLT